MAISYERRSRRQVGRVRAVLRVACCKVVSESELMAEFYVLWPTVGYVAEVPNADCHILGD